MPVQETRGKALPPACRWRSSDETLDVIEALERIEALLVSLDERMRRVEADVPPRLVSQDGDAASAPVSVSSRR